MKKLSIIHFLGLALLAMTFNACVEDPTDPGPGGIFPELPELSLVDEAGFTAFDATVAAGAQFNVKISASAGDSPLNAFYLQEDNLEIAPARFLVDGVDSGANPKLILGSDKENLEWALTITAHEVGSREYRFVIEDEAGETSSQTITIDTDGGTPPTVDVQGSGMYDADPGSLISLPFVVEAGTFSLASISVYENDVLIEDYLNRLYYDDLSNPFDSNPYLIPSSDVNSFDRTIFVRASEDAGTNVYRVEIADEVGNITDYTFDITTGVSGTPVTTLQGVLFNRAGPSGTGGLDLDTGVGTGSGDAEAEIRDEGIDSSVANDINWIRNIAGVNGSELRLIFGNEPELTESFTFDGIEVSEQVAALEGIGTAFTNTNAAGDLVSWLVEVGDMYTVKGATKNYLIIIREVNETPGDNDDNYVIDIKY